jgi:hypothetical protein
MPVLATTLPEFVGYCVIGGGAAILIGAVFTLAALTPRYKEIGWSEGANAIGVIIGGIGAAFLFFSSVAELTLIKQAFAKAELLAAVAVSLTVSICFGVPRCSCAVRYLNKLLNTKEGDGKTSKTHGAAKD